MGEFITPANRYRVNEEQLKPCSKVRYTPLLHGDRIPGICTTEGFLNLAYVPATAYSVANRCSGRQEYKTSFTPSE